MWYANAWTPLVNATESSYWVLPISRNIISWNEKNYFVLKVEWTSMNKYEVNNKIVDNWSYILVKKDEVNLNERDAFLFLVNWWATIKTQRKDGDNIYLLPHSHDEYHKPIILSSSDNIEVNWKVVDVFNF